MAPVGQTSRHSRQPTHLEPSTCGVAAGGLGHLGQLDPFLLCLAHNGRYDNSVGIVLLEAFKDIEIHFHG